MNQLKRIWKINSKPWSGKLVITPLNHFLSVKLSDFSPQILSWKWNSICDFQNIIQLCKFEAIKTARIIRIGDSSNSFENGKKNTEFGSSSSEKKF